MRIARLGKPLSEAIKAKMRGKKVWSTGIKFDAEYCDRISKGHVGQIAHNKKMVLDMGTGIFYDSVHDAAKSSIYTRSCISRMLSGVRKNKTNYIYI